MKKEYRVVVETFEGSKYESTIGSRYELESVASKVADVKPETFIMIGTDLALHAGDIKAMMITGEVEAENGTV